MAFGDKLNSFTNQSTAPGSSFSASGSQAVSVGDLIVVLIGHRSATDTTNNWQDNLGNSYTEFTPTPSAGNARTFGAWARVTNAGTLTSCSFSITSGTSNDVAVVVGIFAGPFATSPLDKEPTPVGDSTSPYDCPSSGTLSQADELVIGLMAQGNGGTAANYTATSPSTLTAAASSGTGANTASAAMSHRVVSATTAVAPQFTSDASTSGNTKTLTFKKDANITASMAVTEAQDVTAANVLMAVQASMAVTEAQDVTAANALMAVQAAMATTEAPDVMAGAVRKPLYYGAAGQSVVYVGAQSPSTAYVGREALF